MWLADVNQSSQFPFVPFNSGSRSCHERLARQRTFSYFPPRASEHFKPNKPNGVNSNAPVKSNVSSTLSLCSSSSLEVDEEVAV